MMNLNFNSDLSKRLATSEICSWTKLKQSSIPKRSLNNVVETLTKFIQINFWLFWNTSRYVIYSIVNLVRNQDSVSLTCRYVNYFSFRPFLQHYKTIFQKNYLSVLPRFFSSKVNLKLFWVRIKFSTKPKSTSHFFSTFKVNLIYFWQIFERYKENFFSDL